MHEAHKLVAGETTGATCTTDGYTYYTCACGYAEERDFVRSKGHNVISTTYDYDENNDGIFGCVGCGRCLAKCPISMNIVKVMKKIGGDVK